MSPRRLGVVLRFWEQTRDEMKNDLAVVNAQIRTRAVELDSVGLACLLSMREEFQARFDTAIREIKRTEALIQEQALTLEACRQDDVETYFAVLAEGIGGSNVYC